jgi:hypothetical protein
MFGGKHLISLISYQIISSVDFPWDAVRSDRPEDIAKDIGVRRGVSKGQKTAAGCPSRRWANPEMSVRPILGCRDSLVGCPNRPFYFTALL